jgi:phage-related protein
MVANLSPFILMRNTRPIVWLKAARRDFEDFPDGAKDRLLDVLTVVAEGGMPPIAKPLVGLGAGMLELALAFRGDAYRVVCAMLLGPDVWVIHAFQKKSKSGIKTPKQELNLTDVRLRRVKEMLK